jgi:hypothetical protein
VICPCGGVLCIIMLCRGQHLQCVLSCRYAKNVTAPWICVKLIRFLQIFSPPSDPAVLERLNAALGAIMNLGPLKQWSNSEGVKDAIVR